MKREEAVVRAKHLAHESNAKKSREQVQQSHKELRDLFREFDLCWSELT